MLLELRYVKPKILTNVVFNSNDCSRFLTKLGFQVVFLIHYYILVLYITINNKFPEKSKGKHYFPDLFRMIRS